MPFIKSIAAWLVILALAIANGALREAVLVPMLGKTGGLVLSGLLLSLFVLVVAFAFVRLNPGVTALQGILIGILWLCLTLAFEFGFGRWVQHKPWAELFEAYVRKAAPKTVELTFTRMHGGKPWMTSFDNPFVQAAGRAIEKGFGQTPVFTREGGSIPVVSTFQEVLGLPSVLFGVGLPDENAHAPNEKLDVGNFHGGIIASAYLYDEVSRIGVPA